MPEPLPTILVTRPEPDALPLAESLKVRGFATLTEPMLSVEFAPKPDIDLNGVQALMFTSANGVRAFATASDNRTLPAFAVGPVTAQAARKAGFDKVVAADGDVEALSGTVQKALDPKGGILLHIAGTVTAGDLKGALERRGFSVQRMPLYRTRPASALSAPCLAALDSASSDKPDRLVGATFFSPRTAKAFVSLSKTSGRTDCLAHLTAICLSEKVAEAVQPDLWRATAVSAEPEGASLVETAEMALGTTRKQPGKS